MEGAPRITALLTIHLVLENWVDETRTWRDES